MIFCFSKYGLESQVVTDPRPVWNWSLPGRIEIRVTSLSEGFTLPLQKLEVITEEEIFGKRERRRHRSTWKEGAAVEGIGQLQPGDPVVHRDHGIGLYRGLGFRSCQRYYEGAPEGVDFYRLDL